MPDTPLHSGFVALVGPTNAGKSTLMNALVGEKIAIMTPKPQTTRNRILGIHTLEGRGQIVFVDTPGLHWPEGRLGQRMMEVALQSLDQADVALLVVDATLDAKVAGHIAKRNLQALDEVAGRGRPVVVALNKVDKVRPKPALLPVLEAYAQRLPDVELVPVSALTRDGLDDLERTLLARLPEGPPLYPEDMLSDQAERSIAAEIVREQLILQTREELPYATAVEVEKWEDPAQPGQALRIAAVIHVEREGQKGIVIGKGGERLKSIGTAARQELERVFDTKVFLELFVRVEPDWTNDPKHLQRFGY